MTTPAIDWPTLRGHLLKLMKERGVTFGQLATWTGLQRSTINGAFTVNQDTQWGTVGRILAALGLDLLWVAQVGGKTCKRKRPKSDSKRSQSSG